MHNPEWQQFKSEDKCLMSFLKSDSEPLLQSNLLDKHTLLYCICDTVKSEEKLLPRIHQKRKFFLPCSQIYQSYSYHVSNLKKKRKKKGRTELVVVAVRTIFLCVTGEEVYPFSLLSISPSSYDYCTGFSICLTVPSSSSPFCYVRVIWGCWTL